MLPPVPEQDEQEEAVLRRLRALADAARLPLPSVDVVQDRKRWKVPASVDIDAGEEHSIEVTEHLLMAGPAEQDWYLAACLAWWASPAPRRRARQGLIVYAAALVPHLVFGFGQLTGLWHLPKPVLLTLGTLIAVVLPLAQAFSTRHAQRGLEAAGLDVLRDAGRDPAVVARQAFGGRTGPRWYQRPFAIEPSPAQRIAAAERHEVRPQPSLF